VTPPISSIRCNGNTYTFTDNFFGGLAILRNDTVLNGNGFSIFGSGGGTGVLVQNASNVLLKNLKVRYFENGIYLDNSNESLITGNLLDCKLTVSHNSTNNLITNNTVTDDICIELSDNNTVEENLVSSITSIPQVTVTRQQNPRLTHRNSQQPPLTTPKAFTLTTSKQRHHQQQGETKASGSTFGKAQASPER
jgi:parallel beta-helix repeat protein